MDKELTFSSHTFRVKTAAGTLGGRRRVETSDVQAGREAWG